MKMKNTIRFSIRGNPDDQHGDPVPYPSILRRILQPRKAKEYRKWQEYVRHAFYTHCPAYLKCKDMEPLVDLPPLTTTAPLRAEMRLRVYWMNGVPRHASRIFEGLADTLFEDHAYLEGSINSYQSLDVIGRIEVEITHEIPHEVL